MKVLYITAKGGIHDYRFLKKLVEDYEVLLLHYAADEMISEIQNIKGLKIISRTPFIKAFPLLSEYFHFKKTVREFKPDIIHTGYVWQVGVLASLYNFHPHLSMAWGSDVLTEPDNNFAIRKIVRKVMRQADHVQCDAEFVKQKIIGDYNIAADKITVFPWGIDLDIFKKLNGSECRGKLNIDLNKFVIIFNRYFDPVYGVNYLLEGFKKFAADKDDVLLLMLSEGPGKAEAQKFITENNLGDKIKLVGRIPNDKLYLYLNASDVYISTSLSDGTSLSMLEAMACGLGLVVSDVPAIKEWVDSCNGIMIPRKDSDAVANALNKYFNGRDLIEKHSLENIKIAAERADWNKNYEKLRQIYSILLNSKNN